MSRIWTAVAFAGLFICLDLRRYIYLVPLEQRPLFMLALTCLLTLLFALFCWAVAHQRTQPEARADRLLKLGSHVMACLLLLALAHEVLGSPFYSASLMWTLGAACLAVVVLYLLPGGSRLLPVLALLLAVAAMTFLVRTSPFGERGGDMLPLVRQGAQRFLAGESPYQDLRMLEGGSVAYASRPMPYPPLMWLSYVPLEAAGLDLRWLSVVSVLALGFLWLATTRVAGEGLERGFTAFIAVALFLTPTYLLRAAAVQTPVYWLLLALVGWAIARGAGPLFLGGLLGLALGARESTVILLPLAAVAYLRQGRGALLRFTAAASIATAVVYLPFLITRPAAFLSSLSYNAVYVTALERPLTHIGFGPWLANVLGGWAVNLVQALLCIGVYLFAFRRTSGRRELLLLLGAVYFMFMLFNPLIHEYYYYPGLLLLAFGLMTNES